MQPTLFGIGIFIVIGISIYIWVVWMKFCLKYWIQRWAKIRSLELVNFKHHPFGGGPFHFTFLFILPVFKVTVIDLEGEQKSGWAWLDIGFFYFGKGKENWD